MLSIVETESKQLFKLGLDVYSVAVAVLGMNLFGNPGPGPFQPVPCCFHLFSTFCLVINMFFFLFFFLIL